MKLFVGLGNPGEKYERQRHNIGFRALDRIAETYNFAPWKKKFKGLWSEGLIGKEKILLLKPQTYMNESGQSVGEAAGFYNLSEDDIIIFHDELDLPPGKIKVKVGGGNAGHNGLRSLSAHVGNDTVRIRLGIGHPGSKEAVVRYVLSDFSRSDEAWLEDLLDATARATPYLTKKDLQGFMNKMGTLLTPQPMPRKDVKEDLTKPSSGHQERVSRQHKDLSEGLDKKGSSFLRSGLSSWIRGRKPSK